MKPALLLTLAALNTFAAASASAAPETVTRVLKDTTTVIALELTPERVFCTDRGYGNVQLKVSVPDLDWLAHYDHRVFGEGLPCMTAGRCSPELQPETILDPNDTLVLVPLRVILSEVLVWDRATGTCTRDLTENTESTIRGRKFTHYRGGDHQVLTLDKCLKLSQAI